ncbi:MAG: NADH:ubiquinone reductase (Na(+)-transporting) subunit F [Alphaproteobacteria bacterium]
MIEILLGTTLLTLLVLALTAGVMSARGLFYPARQVAIEVNGRMRIVGTTGDKLLSVLNNADIPVPSTCAGKGTCGLCKVTVLEGAGEPLPTERARLERTEIGNGIRLACQIVIRNPLSVSVPDEILAAERLRCRVISAVMLSPLIRELVLEIPEDCKFAFRAGAFMQVEIPPYSLDFADIDVGQVFDPVWQKLRWRRFTSNCRDPVSRAYSIASNPSDTSRIVLVIRLALPPPGVDGHHPPGVASSYLFGVNCDDIVDVTGPFGEFYVRDTDREMVLIGGGVGMAPLKAIIFDQLERVGTKRKISYWFGARTLTDVFYGDEFDDLARRHDNFTWTVALSEPPPNVNWQGPTGFVHDIVFRSYLADHPAPESCEYYLCGPPLMMQAVLAMLETLGVDDAMIYFDDFGS